MSNYVAVVFLILVAIFTFNALVGDDPDSIKSTTYDALNDTVTLEQSTKP